MKERGGKAERVALPPSLPPRKRALRGQRHQPTSRGAGASAAGWGPSQTDTGQRDQTHPREVTLPPTKVAHAASGLGGSQRPEELRAANPVVRWVTAPMAGSGGQPRAPTTRRSWAPRLSRVLTVSAPFGEEKQAAGLGAVSSAAPAPLAALGSASRGPVCAGRTVHPELVVVPGDGPHVPEAGQWDPEAYGPSTGQPEVKPAPPWGAAQPLGASVSPLCLAPA